MIPWLENNHSPIGLDVGHRCVKAVQLGKTGQGWRAQAVAVLPRRHVNEPLGADEARWLRQVLERQGFVGSRLVTTAPAQSLITNVLELPPRASGAPVESIARMEMARLQRCDAAAFEMALWDLPMPARSGAVSHMMAAACPHRDADLLMDDLQAAGWQVLAFDVPAWALQRALQLWPAGGTMTPVLDIGAAQSQFILFHEGVVAYERRLVDLGLAPLFEALGREQDLDDEGVEHWLTRVGLTPGPPRVAGAPGIAVRLERNLAMTGLLDRLRKELRVSLSFVTHRYPEATMKRLALIGGGAAIGGFAADLAGDIAVELVPVRLEDVVSCADAVVAHRQSTGVLVALGLAMYAPD